MEQKTLSDFEKKYEIDLGRVASKIKKEKAKLVLLQFPDGLKQYATSITDYLREKIPDAEFIIWAGSCFGACDVPLLAVSESAIKGEKIDMIIQFGHNALMPDYL